MYDWIIQQKDILNIKFVSHLGDVVAYGNRNWEWERTAKPIHKMDGIIPSAINVGNHDSGDGRDLEPEGESGPNDEWIKGQWGSGGSWAQRTKFDEYFPLSKLSMQPGWGGEHNGKTYSTYQYFEAAGLEFMIIHIELKGQNGAMDWANGITSENPNKRIIVSTHDVTDNNDVLWQVAKQHENVFLVISGHSFARERHVTYEHANGDPLHEIMSDYQNDNEFDNGGTPYDGSVRYYTFYPAENRIDVKTIHTARNNLTGEYETDDNSQFSIDYIMDF